MNWSFLDYSISIRRRRNIRSLLLSVVSLIFPLTVNVVLASDQTSVRMDHQLAPASRDGRGQAIAHYVEEASRRFLIPRYWICAVMKVESAGDVRALSNKGAMGLMQIMPKTWEMLRHQHALGDDPYNPRDNILAGAAYLRELHDRYGESGFLAAYNAGPGRYEEHLNRRHDLPAETVDYVLRVRALLTPERASGGLYSAGKSTGVSASALFPAPRTGPDDLSLQNENLPVNRSEMDQHIVDLSAITPDSTGLFAELSHR